MKFNFEWLRNIFTRGDRPAPEEPNDETKETLDEIKIYLDLFMSERKPFLLSRYSLYQLSEDSGMSISTLSAFIEYRQPGGYSDLINSYRIRYCQKLLQRMPRGNFDIFDLCIICGFTDEKEFCDAFEKFSGRTIQDYVRRTDSSSSRGMGAGTVFILLLLAITGLHVVKHNNQRMAPAPNHQPIVVCRNILITDVHRVH